MPWGTQHVDCVYYKYKYYSVVLKKALGDLQRNRLTNAGPAVLKLLHRKPHQLPISIYACYERVNYAGISICVTLYWKIVKFRKSCFRLLFFLNSREIHTLFFRLHSQVMNQAPFACPKLSTLLQGRGQRGHSLEKRLLLKHSCPQRTTWTKETIYNGHDRNWLDHYI